MPPETLSLLPAAQTGAAGLGIAALLGYLFGAIPFGLVAARLWRLPDPRQIGSRNIGATNVLRTGSRSAALFTLIGDAGKGAVAVLVARALAGEDAAQIAGLAAFAGHLWPVWIGFRGGKGVATFLGTLIALYWPLGLAACASWLVAAALSRISSVGALAAALLAPAWAWLMGRPDLVALSLVLAALILWRHRANIGRILRGEEPRIGQGR